MLWLFPPNTCTLKVFCIFKLQYKCAWNKTVRQTLQLCTSCWWAAVFLLEAAAFWDAAMAWVAAAAACLAAFWRDKHQVSNVHIHHSFTQQFTVSLNASSKHLHQARTPPNNHNLCCHHLQFCYEFLLDGVLGSCVGGHAQPFCSFSQFLLLVFILRVRCSSLHTYALQTAPLCQINFIISILAPITHGDISYVLRVTDLHYIN